LAFFWVWFICNVANFSISVSCQGTKKGTYKNVKKRFTRLLTIFFSCALLLLVVLAWSLGLFAHANTVKKQTTSKVAAMTGDLAAHDPSLIKQGKTWYLFSTGLGIVIRTSTDQNAWTYESQVFSTIPAWISTDLGTAITSLWSPDIHLVNGTYYLYYAASSYGTNNSLIGLATNTTLDPGDPNYHWVDQGLVMRSTTSDTFNAIDPNLAIDAHVQPWLDFGSFWSGIRMIRLDRHSYKAAEQNPQVFQLAGNSNTGAIEGANIIFRNGYYYLFASIDYCCAGAYSSYKSVVGRATSITGPYFNEDGNVMGVGADFTILLAGYSNVRGPGGGSVYQENGEYYYIHHYYDGASNGTIKFFIRDLSWTNNWPQATEPINTTSTLQGQWNFDEGTGMTTADAAGNGNSAVLDNASWTTSGHSGNGLHFNGSSSYNDVVNTGGSFTVSAWVKLDALTGYETAVSQEGSQVAGFYLQLQASGKFAFNVPNGDSPAASGRVALGTTIAQTGTWYFLTGVRDVANNQLRLYVNGTLEATTTLNTGYWNLGDTIIGRGEWNSRNSDFWNGDIDDVSLSSGILTASEIQTLYTA
jgi:arabinan endo-1,5-alpha-L-arabinosidase